MSAMTLSMNPGEMTMSPSGMIRISPTDRETPALMHLPWHLGKCINAGVSRSVGDILIIPDGDIVISPGFIDKVIADIAHDKSLVTYYRRFDETSKIIANRDNFDIQDLEKHCVLTN